MTERDRCYAELDELRVETLFQKAEIERLHALPEYQERRFGELVRYIAEHDEANRRWIIEDRLLTLNENVI